MSLYKADVTFLLDTTGSMSGLVEAMATGFGGITGSLSGTITDPSFGVATYDDYAYSSYGMAGTDLPFILRQQQTTDSSLAQGVLNSLPIHHGGDSPESTLEALYQVATGAGYDQNCNQSYDASTDVKPFIASAADAFGGGVTGVYSSSVTGTGTLGGMGFRDGAVPIVIYATDNLFRDPNAGDGAPGGCADDAGMAATIAALNGIGARTIGIGVPASGYIVYSQTQFNRIATGTDSSGDMDGNGSTEPAYYYDVATGDATPFTLHLDGVPVDGPGGEVVRLELSLIGVSRGGGELVLDQQELTIVISDGG